MTSSSSAAARYDDKALMQDLLAATNTGVLQDA